MRVLVVDDSEVMRKMLGGLLTTAGFEVEMAGDGVEALSKLRDGAIRLVVSDWEMPNMSGLALCRAIRTEQLPGYVYVLLLTRHGSVEERVAGLSAGADDFLPKPFNPDELIARVRSGLRVISIEQK